MIDTKLIDNQIKFINAAQELIEQHGLEKISIRKIALNAGFHNSTIYLYFEDLDQLIMLASMKYFQQYSQMLEIQSQKVRNAADNFYAIWGYFLDTILERPHLFYNFFFGKCSNYLGRYMNMYYEIFPEERKQFTNEIELMYFGQNITERSFGLLKPLIGTAGTITDENVNIINELIVSHCKYKLEQKRQDESLDSDEIKSDFFAALSHVTGIPK